MSLAVLIVGCAPKIEAEVTDVNTTGVYPEIKIHVKTNGEAYLRCDAAGNTCDPDAVPKLGQADITIKIEPLKGTPDKIVIDAYRSPSRSGSHGTATIDFSKKPVLLRSGGSSVKCLGRKCDVFVLWGPTESANADIEPGAVVEIAGTKLNEFMPGTARSELKSGFLGKPFADLPLTQTMLGDDNAERGKVPLTITFKDGTKLSTQLSLTAGEAKSSVRIAMRDVLKGPVLFAGETSGKPTGHAAYMLEAEKIVGSPHTLHDVDYVAVYADATIRTSSCAYQSGAKATLNMHDVDAKLYERRTGHVGATKHFEAPHTCDTDVYHRADQAMPAQDTHVPAATIEAWVVQQIGH
jgi:hypothetical protein